MVICIMNGAFHWKFSIKLNIILELLVQYFTGTFRFFTGNKILSETWKKIINRIKIIFYRTFKLSPIQATEEFVNEIRPIWHFLSISKFFWKKNFKNFYFRVSSFVIFVLKFSGAKKGTINSNFNKKPQFSAIFNEILIHIHARLNEPLFKFWERWIRSNMRTSKI